jgi:hypothetical protein
VITSIFDQHLFLVVTRIVIKFYISHKSTQRRIKIELFLAPFHQERDISSESSYHQSGNHKMGERLVFFRKTVDRYNVIKDTSLSLVG